ncbi:MAG: ATP-binding cassette domain-containing protein [Puniceicoccales bacterium]|jgi:peptide/nickel transport system ATP-binding protein|nr:ATP-binding cassette domain-containing protein [Puniceicoccales bacterium]
MNLSLELRRGTVRFAGPRRLFHRPEPAVLALDDVSLKICRGECWGLVGESGSGKTTLAYALAQLQKLDSGTVLLNGTPARSIPRRAFCRRVQLVFQSPQDALNPRRSVGQTLREPLNLHFPGRDRRWREERVEELLAAVQLPAQLRDSFPENLSGGQRQRVAIARSLAVEPEFLICDEVVSALDSAIREEIVQLLRRTRDSHRLGMLFIAHDLPLVGQLCSHVAILQNGRLVERGEAAAILAGPATEHGRELLRDSIC